MENKTNLLLCIDIKKDQTSKKGTIEIKKIKTLLKTNLKLVLYEIYAIKMEVGKIRRIL